MTVHEVADRIERGPHVHILDVRSEREFAAGHVPGAVNIPFTKIGSRVELVPASPDEELVLYCGHGPRAYIAAALLRPRGWKRIVYMRGHWAAWKTAALPQTTISADSANPTRR